ncbi:MAG: hypothetical protein DRH12_17325 [Deltaproteobacteria bacterium]|nr:MAG: hypothetical protein DRH12_17325 [Deltaproteobacteria bacterium]
MIDINELVKYAVKYGLSQGIRKIVESDVEDIGKVAEKLWYLFVQRKPVEKWEELDFEGAEILLTSPEYSASLRQKVADYILSHLERAKEGVIEVLRDLSRRHGREVELAIRETLILLKALDVLRPAIRLEEYEELKFNETPPQPEPEGDELDDVIRLLEEKKQVILMGPPGIGKTHLAMWAAYKLTNENKDGKWLVLQFHPSYRYEDFMERLMFEPTNGSFTVKYKPMVFVNLCRRAEKNPNKKYVIVLDEINRANVYNVFGELLYALEYRDQKVTLLYSNLPLQIPENLYIIATANTVERGTFEIGVALRRRFNIFEMEADKEKLSKLLENVETSVKEKCIKIFELVNRKFEEKLGRAGIGHLFFKDVKGIESLKREWRFVLKPLIKSYFAESEDIVKEIEEILGIG